MSKNHTSKVVESKAIYDNILYKKSFNFAVRIVKFYKHLLKNDKSLRSLYEQLLRSGTSIGANVSDAQSANYKKDYINKLLKLTAL